MSSDNEVMNNNEDNNIEKKVTRKRKVECDENGNPIKKVRKTKKVLYPKVKTQPRTAYMFFMTEKAKEARETEGGAKLNTKTISEMWNATTDRSKWEEMAKADKERFYEEVKSHGYDIKEKKSEPTRPCSAYLLYASANHKAYCEEHNCTYQEALTALGERWKDPNREEERRPFIEEAARRKEEWLQKKKTETVEEEA